MPEPGETLIPLAEVARLEEGQAAHALATMADEARPFFSGVMARGAPGLWSNNVIGAGLDGPVSPDAGRQIRDFYEPRGVEPRVELCPFAHETLRTALAAEGFTLALWEMVFFRPLDAARPVSPAVPLTAPVTLEALDRGDAETIRVAARLATACFAGPDHVFSEDDHELFRRNACSPSTVTVIARAAGGPGEPGGPGGGRVVGVAGMAVHTPPGRPAFSGHYGAAVDPAWRRQGVQQAMLAWRLNEAARRGCVIATIGSRPGVATERNVRRLGFEHAYTKVVLTRPGPGLRGVQT